MMKRELKLEGMKNGFYKVSFLKGIQGNAPTRIYRTVTKREYDSAAWLIQYQDEAMIDLFCYGIA